MTTIAALFDRYEDAHRAIRALYNYGVLTNEISVMTRAETVQGRLDYQVTRPEDRDSAVGNAAVGGAATGGLIGLVAGVAALVIPGIGPVISAGTLTTALGLTAAGAGIGAAAGGLIGAMTDLGLSEEETDVYAEGIKRGGILVTVRTEEDERDEVEDLLEEAGAVDVNTRREEWQRSGWRRFEETPVVGRSTGTSSIVK
jgi:hypothetical protein